MRFRWWSIAVMLVLLSPILFSAECTRVGVFVDRQILKDSTGVETGTKLSATVKEFANFTTVTDAQLGFYDKDGMMLPGCGALKATVTPEDQAEFTDPDNRPYVYECVIQKSSFYAGGCNYTYARVTGPSKYCSAQAQTQLCDYSGTVLTSLPQLFQTKANNLIADPQTSPACVLGMLALGVLLATMFYSGKSPLSILDITTPNLPQPKSIAASGQLLGQMVYGRMRAERIKRRNDMNLVLEKGIAEAKLSAANQKWIASLAGKGRADAETRKLTAAVGAQMLASGKFSKKEIEGIFRGKSMLGYTEEEHGELGKIIQRLRQLAKTQGERLYAGTLDEYVLNYTYLNKMEILTGQSGSRGGPMDFMYQLARTPIDGPSRALSGFFPKTMDKIGKVPLVNKIIDGPWLGRFPIIGGFAGTSVDAFFRSARITGRYAEFGLGYAARKLGRIDKKRLQDMSKALEDDRTGKAVLSYPMKMAYRAATAGAAETTKIGGMYPIQKRMAEMYTTLYAEAHNDAIAYVLKQLYAKHGVNFNISEDQWARMAFEAKYDPIAMMNLAKARGLVTLEAEIRKVLSIYYDPNKHASEFDPIFLKLNGLKELARAYGVHLDPAMDEALGKLKQIHDNKSYEDHMKLILMHNYLTSVHHTNDVNFNPQAGEGRFYFRVGRDSLSYGTGPNAHSDLWEVFNLRKLMYSAESIAKDGTKGGFQGGLADIIKETWIYSLSRMRGFDLYSNVLGGAASTNDATIKARRDAYAHDLMTEEGRRMARQLGGAGSDNWTKILSAEAQIKQALSGRAPWRDIRVEFGDKGTPSLIKTLLSSLDYLTGRNSSAYFAKGIAASRVNAMFPQTFEGGAEIAYRERADLKKGQIPFMDERPVSIGDSREISPRIGFWKVDMKRIWETGHEATVGYYVDSIFGKGYKTPYKASIYREMMGPNGMIIDPATGKPVDPSNVSKRFAEDRLKPIYRRDTLMGEMYDFLNGTMAMNAYRYTNETVRFYAKAAQAILGGAVLDAVKNKRDGDPDYERAKAIFREIENLDVTTKEGGDRFAKILEKHAKQFNEFLNKPVTYDMMARAPHAWVMMHEGGYVPFIKGMPLSDFDRVMNGHVALKDSEGHWRRFDPQSMDMNFGTDASGMRFKREFAALQNQKDRHGSTQMMDEKGNVVNVRWDDFLTRMADWAKGDFAKQKIYNTVLWRYAQSTSDWNEFWEKSDITIRPKNEVLGIRIGALPFASHEEMSASVMEPFRKVREKLRDFGMWLELSSMYAGGRTYTASYDVTPVSELYREHYRDTAEQVRLIQSDLVGKNAAEKAAVLKNYGISEGMYNNMLTYARGFHSEYIIWNFGIDRAPQRHSTSYGLQNAMASSFQYGPAAAWDPRWYNAYFENRWASLPFTFAQGGVNLVRHLALPAITSFRTFQMNLFGYPNKWNYSDSNPMQPWDYRSPDALGAVRSVLNPFSASLNWFNFGDMQGEMIQRDTGGAKYRRGLASIPVEFSWIYKGITYAARRGDANPGLSTYDSRGTLGLTSAMAEYLAHRDQFAGYFGTDQNLQKRAHTTFIKREVGAPALALKREEELRGYSPLANPIHAWWNPVLFLWHLPISPVSPRDMYMHYKEGTRRMDWEDMSVGQKASQILGGGGGGMLPTMMAQIKPWYRDEEGNIKLYGMNSGGLNPRGDRKQIVYCQLCSSPMQRWGSCASCMKRRGGRA